MRHDRPALSWHLIAEIEHVHRRGPLGPRDPVPGCGCALCLTLAAGGTWDDATLAARIVRTIAQLPPEERREAAETLAGEVDAVLPAPGVLAALAALEPGAARSWRPRQGTAGKGKAARPPREPLDIPAARRADILAVAVRLGLGEPRKAGRNEYMVRCPFHDDRRPSLRLRADAGLWYCDPCGFGGDVIELVRRVRRVSFADAVRELAGGRRAA